jgi:putative ABC transport system ATP-binding protein
MTEASVNSQDTANTGESERKRTLQMTGVSKTYQMGDSVVHALREVDFDLYTGELVVLLGPSGSGKSTLLNILGGLDSPSSGKVHYDGGELTAFDDQGLTQFRRDHVGFVFQFYNLIPSLTARENVSLVTEIAADPMPVDDALDMVNLGDRRDHFPAQLSGGEQQRVAIARAIAKRPGILLCDEPTGALDSETGIVVLEAIERVNRELGAATALITHNAAIAAIADRVVSLADGKIASVVENTTRAAARDMRW